jgi:hypothetical protein
MLRPSINAVLDSAARAVALDVEIDGGNLGYPDRANQISELLDAFVGQQFPGSPLCGHIAVAIATAMICQAEHDFARHKDGIAVRDLAALDIVYELDRARLDLLELEALPALSGEPDIRQKVHHFADVVRQAADFLARIRED